MLKTTIQQKKEQRFKNMAVLLAKYLRMDISGDFDTWPEPTKTLFLSMRYIDIVTPLMIHDRRYNKMSYKQISIKYGVAKTTIYTIIKNSVQQMERS